MEKTSYSPRDSRDDKNVETDPKKGFWKKQEQDKTNGFYGQKHSENEHEVSPSPSSTDSPAGSFYKKNNS